MQLQFYPFRPRPVPSGPVANPVRRVDIVPAKVARAVLRSTAAPWSAAHRNPVGAPQMIQPAPPRQSQKAEMERPETHHAGLAAPAVDTCRKIESDRADHEQHDHGKHALPPRGRENSAQCRRAHSFLRNAFPIRSRDSGLSHCLEPRTFLSTRPCASTRTVRGIVLAPSIDSSSRFLS